MAYVSKEFQPGITPAVSANAEEEQKTAVTEASTVTPEVEETAKVDETEDDEDFYLKFSKPYKFEGTEYEGIDLSGIVDLTAADQLWAERHCSQETMLNPVKEMSTEMAMLLATRATGKPIEFFKFLPMPDMTKIRLAIVGFTYGEE